MYNKYNINREIFMVTRPIIDPELKLQIQRYANMHFNGNFTQAVNSLLRKGLSK